MFHLDKKAQELKDFFLTEPSIGMAFIFGSYATGCNRPDSDFDIAVYFAPGGSGVEIEEDKIYPDEERIWDTVEDIVGVNLDFIVLNRAKVTLAYDILQTGIPVIVRNRRTYLNFVLTASSEAEFYRKFAADYWAIEQRSASLDEADKHKLIEKTKFLSNELNDRNIYTHVDQNEYQNNRLKRRSLERWVENIVNASIDIGKIILASEKKRFPDTYREILNTLSEFPDFSEVTASTLASYTKLRNVLAHEYLDIRFERIRDFLDNSEEVYRSLIDFVNRFIED